MISNDVSPGDVKQGILGDCWLLGAFCVLATRPELLKNLIVYDGIEHGFAVFQFFKNGKWQHVIVDTKIPYNPIQKCPLYGHCLDQSEFWVPLMEKAYAKLNSTYENLNGGSMAESLVDLTGGVSEKHNLRAPDTQEKFDNNNQLWKEIKKYHQLGYLIGCAATKKDEDGKQEEQASHTGLLYNHAYGIMDVQDVQQHGLNLVRVRNPWGSGEWTGKFSDEDEAWDDHKGLKDKLNYQFSEDGTFWMEFNDWFANFTKIYVCKIFPATWS